MFKSHNLTAIARMIVGDDNDYFAYRTGIEITSFFEECNLNYVHDGTTRNTWVSNVLVELLKETPKTPDELPDKFVNVLQTLMDKAGATDDDVERLKALAKLNIPLKKQGYEAYYGDDRLLYIRNNMRNVTINENDNPHDPTATNDFIIFLSHVSKNQGQIKKLQNKFELYEINTFLAHVDIEPSKEWVIELEKYLDKMRLLLAFVTDDFHTSSWTNQEIGYALGKEVNIGTLKFSGATPEGLIGKTQALSCNWNDPNLFEKILQYMLKNKLLPEKIFLNLYNKFRAYETLFGASFILGQPFCETTVKSQERYIESKKPKSNQSTLFINNFHENYFYHTSCDLYKGQKLLAYLIIGHDDLRRGKNLDSLLPSNIFLLDNKCFSRVNPQEELSGEEERALKLLFNHYDDQDKLKNEHPGADDGLIDSFYKSWG